MNSSSNNKVKVSVVIPIYNSQQYLGECLNTVVNQTLYDIEIICINDVSTDIDFEKSKQEINAALEQILSDKCQYEL